MLSGALLLTPCHWFLVCRGGNPGAQVVSAGLAPVTRENRLLSWASEIEAQLSTQRQELRRARMELVAAQEEAKLAREETKRLKAELATSEAERMTAVTNLRQAESVNHLLRAQLSETTTSFTQALEVAVNLLDKAGAKKPASTSTAGAKNGSTEPPKAEVNAAGAAAEQPELKATTGGIPVDNGASAKNGNGSGPNTSSSVPSVPVSSGAPRL